MHYVVYGGMDTYSVLLLARSFFRNNGERMETRDAIES